MRPSADHIASFVEVVRQRSLSAAARSLGLPKSTISRRLSRLERALQSQLLHRTSRSLSLTPTGRAFYESVVPAVDALGEAVSALEHSQRDPRGTIRMTAPSDLGRMVLAPMLVAFLERYPDIELELTFSNDVLDLFAQGIDLALRATRTLPPDLIARRVCDAQLQLAAAPVVAEQLAAADLRSLERQPFVLHKNEAAARKLTLERSSGRRPQRSVLAPTGRVRVDDYAAAAELVSAGHGVAIMPALHVRAGVAAGRLVRVLPDWFVRAGYVYLVYPVRQQPERVRLLGEFLRERLHELPNV
jgi:DNA-binding transcriptional LysR family regulator